MDTLTENDLVIGGKYVPHSKSIGCSLSISLPWRTANIKKQPYLYYKGERDKSHVFGVFPKVDTSDLSGDIFLPSDVTSYVEPVEQTPTSGNAYSERYLEWVKQCKLPLLTNTQRKFAEWLLEEDNSKVIAQIGDLDSIFISVRKFIKNNPKASL